MPMFLKNVEIFSFKEGESKNGYYATITMISRTKLHGKGKLDLFIKDEKMGKKLKALYDDGELKDFCVLFEQNPKFGDRVTEIVDILDVDVAA